MPMAVVVNVSNQTLHQVFSPNSLITMQRNRFHLNNNRVSPRCIINIVHYIKIPHHHHHIPNLLDSPSPSSENPKKQEPIGLRLLSRKMGINQKEDQRKPRFLCLHGFRTSGEIMKKQVLGKWHESVVSKMDLVFVDAPFPCEGKSEVEGIFDPPYYEWFQFDKEFMEYRNFYECLAYIEDLMLKQGPFDGLLGFSQGAILSAALPGLQAKGLALTKVPKIKCLIIIGGAKFKQPALAHKAYSSRVDCPSVHFLGETDFLKPHGTVLLEEFVDPVVIHHPRGHTVPRFDEKSLEMMHKFLEKIQLTVSSSHGQQVEEEKGGEEIYI